MGNKEPTCFNDDLPLGLNAYLDVKYKIEMIL